MKSPIKLATPALALLLLLDARLSSVHAQGGLTPPGVPAPTMKTLAQIEPRTPIPAAPFTISLPGSYYLTNNLSVATGNAITIASGGVTLDLCGFRITSTSAVANGTAIAINTGMRDLAISNGFVQGGVTTDGSGTYSGGGFEYGVYGSPFNTRVSGVSVSGILYVGIYLSSGTVESCIVRTVGGTGIQASIITACEATECGEYGIYGHEASQSQGHAYGSGTGLYAFRTAQNCYGLSGGSGTGMFSHQALNCQGNSSSGIGLSATQAQNCQGQSVSGIGLSATTAQNCVGASTSGTGLNGTNVDNCRGFSASAIGLSAVTAENCAGITNGASTGLSATNALNCQGSATGSGTGLSAVTAGNCTGTSTGVGTGLSVTRIANSCQGTSSTGTGLAAGFASLAGGGVATNCYGTGASGLFAFQAENCYGHATGTGTGLSATSASNCRGQAISGSGVSATTAQNCYGYTTGSGTGLNANLAINCYGQSTANGTGLNAYIANSSQGVSLSGTPLSFTYKYNMP